MVGGEEDHARPDFSIKELRIQAKGKSLSVVEETV